MSRPRPLGWPRSASAASSEAFAAGLSAATAILTALAESAVARTSAPSRMRCGEKAARTLSFWAAGSPSITSMTTVVR